MSLTGYSIPIFWWGLILILYVSPWFGLPQGGRLEDSFWIDTPTGFMLIDTWLSGVPGAFENAVKSLILPAIVSVSYTHLFITANRQDILIV